MVQVKICGLTEAQHIEAAARSGARYIGFNFFSKSPRFVTMKQAKSLMEAVPVGVCKVALVVNPTDDLVDALVAELPVDMLQLHGVETVARVAEIKARFGLPVMKAIGVADAGDLVELDDYARVADQILVDAKPPKDAVLPGGNGLTFDWRLIAGRRWAVPWMLAGGLTVDNVAEAIRLTGAPAVDVSSGVETAPGVKDPVKIAKFIEAGLLA